jgi:cobalt-zinc-cadmium efflux system membrane fusion protein
MTQQNRNRLVAAALVLIAALVSVDIWMRMGSGNAAPAPGGKPAAAEESKEDGANKPLKLEVQAQKNIGLLRQQAESRAVVETLQVTGSIGPNETRMAHIRPLTQGRVLDVNATLGDTVRAGQTLAVYDNIELGELLGQYSVGLAASSKARADAEASQKSLERARNLVSLGAVAQAEVERRSAEHAGGLAAIDTQRAELARIEEKMHRYGLTDDDIRQAMAAGREHREVSRTAVRAPIGGVITKYDVAQGEVVGADRELFTISDLSTVWVQADVYEKDIAAVRKNLTVQVSVDAFPGEVFQGRITYISDVLDPKTRTTKVRCEVANPSGRLKVDMFATIAIPTPQGRTATMVPRTAIQQIDDQSVVFIATSATEFERRNVTLGVRDGDWIEIQRGLQPRETVVTTGSFDLKSLLLRGKIGEAE